MTQVPRPSLKDRLKRTFYARRTQDVARELLGKALIRKIDGRWIGGTIVETEAYLGHNDAACHASRGKTASNASMFEQPGTLYVYPIHAKYCMNAVTEEVGVGAAVLIRAVEPLWGLDVMMDHRGVDEVRRVARGPAMLCQALHVDRTEDGCDLVDDQAIAIVAHDQRRPKVVSTTRIGITKATSKRLRFVVAGNRFVSRPVDVRTRR